MIPSKAIQAIHAAICEESLEDHMDPKWPGRCVKAAQAAAPHLMAREQDDDPCCEECWDWRTGKGEA